MPRKVIKTTKTTNKTDADDSLQVTSVRVSKSLLKKAKANHINLSSLFRDALRKAL